MSSVEYRKYVATLYTPNLTALPGLPDCKKQEYSAYQTSTSGFDVVRRSRFVYIKTLYLKATKG